ncbi:thioredoxin reductase [Actinokineospora baliensis]|uniref:FAD-dependent oxidoreductase n=1 Tax=Actinokineospora baliensis TaxID=547056 RepID=UPI00195A88F4|nr:FAD-dependent oxidoreductase [Actinokineospora baliensis]MBM7774880.1 thioredoxin reductase [Actinokineospora baliensis]
MNELPVVVVGAGPVGLAAAAHLVERGLPVLVLEAGPVAGAAVAQWNHVRLFSSWSELVDPAARRLLAARGWVPPEGYPTGAEWAAGYLAPLAAALGNRVRFGARVTGVARRGRDRVVDAGRDTEPLTVHVGEERITARAVIDASGTWGTPNPLGGDGLPAIGERAAGERISYRVPDLASEAERYAGKRIVVAGSGHSALTALVALAGLAERHPGTHITWLLRRGAAVFGGGDADQLPARGALGLKALAAVRAGHVEVVTGFRTESVERDGDRIVLVSRAGRLDPVDEVVVLTGFRPDLSWLSEVRLDLDPVLGAPTALAPLIDPNAHSCGTVYPHGAAELRHPEPGVYLVGMKSYGRAPTFLAMTGHEQVRSVVAEIAGDHAAAAKVELTLPDTGVCGGSGVFDAPDADQGGGCCGAPVAGEGRSIEFDSVRAV